MKELEVGKDYVAKDGIVVIDRFGVSGNRGFYGNNFEHDLFCLNPNEWREATEEEVIEAFEKHLIHRYGEDWETMKIKDLNRQNLKLTVYLRMFKPNRLITIKMKKINIGGFDAVDLGPTEESCGMHVVVVLNTPKFRYALGSIPDVYVDPRKKATKNNLFLLMGTREQYIELTKGMQEAPWFITKSGTLTKRFTYKR